MPGRNPSSAGPCDLQAQPVVSLIFGCLSWLSSNVLQLTTDFPTVSRLRANFRPLNAGRERRWGLHYADVSGASTYRPTTSGNPPLVDGNRRRMSMDMNTLIQNAGVTLVAVGWKVA